MEKKPILELSTEIVRKHFKLDGELHELRSLDEIGFAQQSEIGRNGRTMQRLMNEEGTLTEEQASELTQAVRDVFLAFVVDGESVIDKLKGGQQLRVVNTFLASHEQEQKEDAERMAAYRQDSAAA